MRSRFLHAVNRDGGSGVHESREERPLESRPVGWGDVVRGCWCSGVNDFGTDDGASSQRSRFRLREAENSECLVEFEVEELGWKVVLELGWPRFFSSGKLVFW